MNKEILFRGKRVDNDEWIEGYFLQLYRSERAFIVPKQFVQRGILRMSGETPPKIISVEVIPETVGQFTGLTDKKGKKIFEGDIVKEWSSHWKTPLKIEIIIYEVVCEYLGSLRLIRKTEYGEYSTPLYRSSVVEVIGNIYDNKELLR